MKNTGFVIIALVVAATACSKNETSPDPVSPADMQPMAGDPGHSPEMQAEARAAAAEAEAQAAEAQARAAEEAAKVAEEKRQNEERVTAAMQSMEEAAQKEQERWTPAMHKKAAGLTKRKFASEKQALRTIVASNHRVPENKKRDKYRHPVETLLFFGVKPGMTVVEMGTGGGWYTEILAPLLARDGKLVGVSYDPEGPSDSMMTVYGKRFQHFLASSPELYGNVQPVVFNPPEKSSLGIDGQADVVIAAREMHGWHRRDKMDAYLAAVHAALKDGGTFGVVQHRAPEGANPDESAAKGYLPEAWVIEQVEAAGFELDKKSEINANPKDTKDYEAGVWALPPSLRHGDSDGKKYKNIGESDRMTLRFRKQ